MLKYLTAVIALTLIGSCSPAKRVARQQKEIDRLMNEYIKNHPIRIDTAVKYKAGKDSTAFFKKQADSLRAVKSKVKDSIIRQVVDTCRQVVEDNFESGFNSGYAVGLAECSQKIRVDTFTNNVFPVDEINAYKKSIIELNQQLTAERDKKNYFWHFIISLSAAIVFLVLLAIKILK